MFDPDVFRENLHAARVQAGLSQKEVAQALFISTQAVSKWERGESVPELSHVYRLAELLGVSVDDLLDIGRERPTALLAVDGGGTKTEFVLITTGGRLLKRVLLPGSNPNTCSVQGCFDILCQGIDLLLQERCRPAALFIGGAGMVSGQNGKQVQALLGKRYPRLKLRCRSDITNVLACADDPDNAIAVICGTGSVVYASCHGELIRCGGGGWRLETLGSGYDLGRGALLAALEHRDNTGPETTLTEAVEQKLGGTVWDSIQKIYSGEPAFAASFAPLVLQAWQTGDPIATELVETNCARLVQLVKLAAKRSPQARQVLLGGSVLRQSKAFRALLEAALPEGLRAVAADTPPVWGACLRSAALAGIAAPDYHTFMADYAQEE